MQRSGHVLGLVFAVLLITWGLVFGGAPHPAFAQQPITISVLDNGGDLASTGVIIENYKKAFPNKVKEIKLQRGPAPETPAKIKAQQDAGRADINLVLTGPDAGSVLNANNQLVKLFPTYDRMFPRDELTEEGKIIQDAGGGSLMPTVANAAGPMLVYNPKKVQKPPKTTQELLAWIKANPKQFFYARSANSGPGRAFLCGMPWILGDKDPMDPEKGWDKTWAFLKELGQHIEYYPTGTAFTLREFAQEQRWMIAGTMEWDMKPRAEGMIPPESQISILDNTTFVVDGHYWGIPKGVPQNELEVLLDMMKFMRRPEQQVLTWKAFLGPVIKAATLDKAPADLREYVQAVWRSEYNQIGNQPGKKWKLTGQPPFKELTYAMDRWDREVGSQKIKQ